MKCASLILLAWACIGASLCHGQSPSHRLGIHYTPQITRTFFEPILENNLELFNEFVETASAHRPVYGYSAGASYSHRFGKFYAGVYVSKNVRGQRSHYAFNYRGFQHGDTARNYGGLYYHFKTKSLSLGLSAGLTLLSNAQYTGGLDISVGLDIFHYSYGEEFSILPVEGILGGGCCRLEFFRIGLGYLKDISTSFDEGYYRAEFTAGWRNEFILFRNFHLNLQPNLYFLTDILKKSLALNGYVPDGIIIAAGLKTELIFKW